MRFQYLKAAASVFLATSAAAAGPAAAPVAQVADVLQCRSVADTHERLECYDGAVAKLSTAIAAGEVVAIDRETIAQERRSLFGFPLPRIGLLGGSDNSPEQGELNTTIASATHLGNGKWLLTLESGASWQSTEALTKQSDPRRGDRIRIKRGAIGGYMLSIEGGPLRRATRVQ